MPFPILSRTQHWIAVDKPAGLPSRPAPGHASSVLRELETWLKATGWTGHPPGVVHRLDLWTSGVLLFSLSPEGHRALVEGFAQRRISKDYTAIVLGWPHPRRGMIDLPLAANTSGRTVVSQGGRPAKTRYQTLRRFPGAALLLAQPLTGRTHQIRVHLAARSMPVLGDAVYGPRSLREAGLPDGFPLPPRLCLHASRLQLPGDGVPGRFGGREAGANGENRVIPEDRTQQEPAMNQRGDPRDRPLSLESPLPPDLTIYLENLARRGSVK